MSVRSLCLLLVMMLAPAALAQNGTERPNLISGGASQGAVIQSSKLIAKGVLQGIAVEGAKLNAGAVLQGAAIDAPKLVAYAVLQSVPNPVLLQRAPLTHW